MILGMHPDPIRLPSLTDREARFYRDEGYLVIPGLVGAEDAAGLKAEVEEIMGLIGLPTRALRQTNQYLRGSRIDALANSPRLRALAGFLMGGEATLYLPFSAVKSPGGG